jgi:hypothetical protein
VAAVRLGRDDDAIVTDIYLDRLLATRDAALAGAGLDLSAEMVAAARTLRRSLQRFHPSFHFEEQLAGRLRPAPGTAAPVPAGRIIAFPGAVAASAPDEPASRIAHRAGLIAWGAAASIVPIVGAALLARRRGRERGLESA